MAIHEDPRKDISPDLDYQISTTKKVLKHLDIAGNTYVEFFYRGVYVFRGGDFKVSEFDMEFSSVSEKSEISHITLLETPKGYKLALKVSDIAKNLKKVKVTFEPPLRKKDPPIDFGISYKIVGGTCMFLEDYSQFYPGDTSNVEDTSMTVKRFTGELVMIVNFLPNYPVRPRAKFQFMGDESQLESPDFKYERDTDSASLVIVGPRIAEGNYIIEWALPRRGDFLES